MSARLDRIDLKMLRLLQNSGRLSNAELADQVGVSPATCHRRTQRLFEEGFVQDVRAMVAPRKLGKGTLVMVGVVLDRSTPESFASFEQAVTKLKCVLDPPRRRRFRLFPENPRWRRRRFQAHPRRAADRAAGRPADADILRDEGSDRQRAAGVLIRPSSNCEHVSRGRAMP